MTSTVSPFLNDSMTCDSASVIILRNKFSEYRGLNEKDVPQRFVFKYTWVHIGDHMMTVGVRKYDFIEERMSLEVVIENLKN